ncbi:MAG: SAM-dependent methyltransferase [Gammaproteobacteria bacterium]|jgi:SAM-dependent methyltransferase
MSDSKHGPGSGEVFTMNSITGKLVLALIRGNDYAHAGEEEAIERVLGPLDKSARTRLLDVGCGIGGTARYVAERHWGKVTGIDLNPENIALAKQRHPELDFICSDVVDLERNVNGPFDIIYLFNAFFLFADRAAALGAMRAVARKEATLALFDYVDLGGYAQWQEHRKTAGLPNTLNLNAVEDLLPASGWAIDRIVPAHAEYERWYNALVARIKAMRKQIVAMSTEDYYDFVLTRFTETRDDVRAGRLGGATIYAKAL